jgi:hypothetical protein
MESDGQGVYGMWQPVLSSISGRLTRDGHKLDIWLSVWCICQEGGLK